MLNRQYKWGHRINCTDIERSNGLDKEPRTVKAVHSYPSPPNGWRQELLLMMMMMMMRMRMRMMIVLYCIVSINLYSASCSAHQSEALPVRETQREESSLERTKRRTWHTS